MEKIQDHHNLWKFWSVQLSALAAAFAGAATAYGAALAISPGLVAGFPSWVGVVLTTGAMVSSGAAIYFRKVLQPSLQEKCDAREVSEDQGQT